MREGGGFKVGDGTTEPTNGAKHTSARMGTHETCYHKPRRTNRLLHQPGEGVCV